MALSEEQAHAARDEAEEIISLAVDRAVRAFLAEIVRATDRWATESGGYSLVAAIGPEEPLPLPLTLGEVSGWWATAVGEEVQEAVRRAWANSYYRVANQSITATSLDRLDDYMARVTDRLVRGITPPLTDDAFDRVRVAITQGAAEGWGDRQVAQRIAADLSWETKGPYWRGVLSSANDRIDAILDPLGPPGSPLREAARLSDPEVLRLQAERSRAVLHLDAEESYWKVRADRITRTEATGAYNYASLSALSDEGQSCKKWLATGDSRTRDSHAAADGQIVPVSGTFEVGDDRLQMPGDPAGSAGNVVNCRCVIVGAPCSEMVDPLAVDDPLADWTPEDGRSTSVLGWTAEDGQEFAQAIRRLESEDAFGALDLRVVATKQGYGTPAVLDAADFDKRVPADAVRVFRGVDDGALSAAKINRAFAQAPTAEVGYGRGMQANGFFFSDKAERARAFANNAQGGMVEGALRPNARVIDFADLRKEYLSEVGSLPSTVVEALRTGPQQQVNLSTYAALRGYDAIRKPWAGTDAIGTEIHYIVLNRSALILKRGGWA